MKRKFFTTLALFYFLLTAVTQAQTVTVSVPDTVQPPGRTLDLPVTISDLSGLQVLSLDATLSFDHSIVRFDSLTATNGTDPDLQNNLIVNYKDEKLYISGGAVNRLRGGGVLFTVHFWISSSVPANSETPILINSFTLNEGSPAVKIKNGSVKIIADTVPPKITAGPEAKEVSDRAIQISWQTDEPTKGKIEFGKTASYGNSVEDKGWTYSHKFVLKELIPGQVYHYRVFATDRFGNGPTKSPDQTFTTSPLSIRGAEFKVSLSDTIDIPIFAPSLNGLNVTSISFGLNFDAQKIAPIAAISKGALTQPWDDLTSTVSGNRLHVSGSGTTALKGKGILLWLRFKVLAGVSAGTELTLNFQSFKFNNGSPPTQTFPIQLTFTQKSAQKMPTVALPDSSFLPATVASLPVTFLGNSGKGVFAIQGKVVISNQNVKILKVDLKNAIVDSCQEFGYKLTPDTLVFWLSHLKPLNDEGTLFRLRVAVGEETHEGDRTTVAFESFQLNAGFPKAAVKNAVLRVYERHDFISGFVRDSEDSTAIAGASVFASEKGGSAEKKVTTNDLGFYQFSGLDTNKQYTIRVQKVGYTSLLEQKDVKPGTKNVNFYLTKENGVLDGRVTTKNRAGIFGVFVVADDGHGHLGSANTDSTGSFAIRHLAKVFPYQLTLTKFGFKNKVLTNLTVNQTISIFMEWNYAHVFGVTQDTVGKPMSGVWVKALHLKSSIVSDSALTGAKGTFQMDSLVTGQYLLYVQKKGFVGAPAQITLNLAPGDSAKVNFKLEKATLATLQISGATEIPNNQSTHFDYVARTASGRIMNLESPVWSLLPEKAGKVANGTVNPNPNYFGEASLSVCDLASSVSDTMALSIYSPVSPTSTCSITNAGGVSLEISAGAVSTPQKIKILAVSLPSIKKSTQTYAAIGRAYTLKPEGYQFSKPLYLEMPVPENYDPRKVVIGRWNKENAEWEVIPTKTTGKNRVAANVTTFSLLAVLNPAKNLGLENIVLAPNPFSPNVDSDNSGHPGLRIAFRVTSKKSRMPFVTIQIYDMLGQKIRTLVNREPENKDQLLEFYWDGQTDDGLLARNGRYILKIDVSDATGTKSVIKSVVMVK